MTVVRGDHSRNRVRTEICASVAAPPLQRSIGEIRAATTPGGRLAISDVVATAAIPVELQNQAAALTGCIAGAHRSTTCARCSPRRVVDVDVKIAPRSAEIAGAWLPGIERFVASTTIEARKPGSDASAGSCCGPGCCA